MVLGSYYGDVSFSGNFHAGEQPGAILKKFDSKECKSFHKLMKDVLRPYVPEFRGEASKDGERILSIYKPIAEKRNIVEIKNKVFSVSCSHNRLKQPGL